MNAYNLNNTGKSVSGGSSFHNPICTQFRTQSSHHSFSSLRTSWTSNAEVTTLDDNVAAVKLVEINTGHQVVQHPRDHVSLLIHRTEHQYPVVSAGRVPSNIGETTIQGDEEPPFITRNCEHHVVLLPAKMFTKNGVDVMSRLLQDSYGSGGDVLVELDFHTSGPYVRTSSRARSAP